MSAGNVTVSLVPPSIYTRLHDPSSRKAITLMPVGTFFQSVPSSDLASAAAAPTPSAGDRSSNAATQLSEAIDDFLADVEKKFKAMSDEVLTKRLCHSWIMGFQSSADILSG